MDRNLNEEMEKLLNQCAETGDYNKAVDELLIYLEKMPDNPLICFYLGLVLVRLKNYQSGIRYLEQAKNAKLDPGQKLRCLVFLGKAYADVKAYSKAERAFREALQTGVPEPGAYSALGVVFYERSMVNQAIDALKKALEIDPNYPGALNNLGYILIETKKDISEGIRLCTQAVQLDPNNPAYRDSLGKALMDNGFYEEAKAELEKAFELAPDNEIVAGHLYELKKLTEGV